MRTRFSWHIYRLIFSVSVCGPVFVCAYAERRALAHLCVLLKVALSSDRKLIVWVLVNDPQEKETESVKQVAQDKGTPLSCGHTGSGSSLPRPADLSHSSDTVSARHQFLSSNGSRIHFICSRCFVRVRNVLHGMSRPCGCWWQQKWYKPKQNCQ